MSNRNISIPEQANMAEARYILVTTDNQSQVCEVAVNYDRDGAYKQYQDITVYHGNLQKELTPEYGMGKPYHDYGNGFYMTVDRDLAYEWAVSLSTGENGYCHAYTLDMSGLRCLRLDSVEDILTWMAILMKHRPGTDSRRWDLIQRRFIGKYCLDVDTFDVIIGYRANDSYLAIAKQFARGEIGVNILGRLLRLGSFGTQVCIKSRLAYTHLNYMDLYEVDYEHFHTQFVKRDGESRRRMRELVNSPDNDLSQSIETII